MKVNGISKKQAGVIYRNWKLGNLDMTQDMVSFVYDYADFSTNYGTPTDYTIVSDLRECVDYLFAGEFEEAQASLGHAIKAHSLAYKVA